MLHSWRFIFSPRPHITIKQESRYNCIGIHCTIRFDLVFCVKDILHQKGLSPIITHKLLYKHHDYGLPVLICELYVGTRRPQGIIVPALGMAVALVCLIELYVLIGIKPRICYPFFLLPFIVCRLVIQTEGLSREKVKGQL